MKKLLLVALVLGTMTSCYQSVITPIEGTDTYTFTKKVDGKILLGVNKINDLQAGPQLKTDQNFLQPVFTSVGYKNDGYYGVARDNKTIIYNVNGNKLYGPVGKVYIYPGFFAVKPDKVVTTVIIPRCDKVVGPVEKIEVAPKAFLIADKGLCGVYNLLGQEVIKPEYESIIQVTTPLGKDFFYLAKVNKKAVWKKISAGGKIQKTLTKAQADRIKADAKKLKGKSFGDNTLGGITVKNLKAY